jgi:hypothetical protein
MLRSRLAGRNPYPAGKEIPTKHDSETHRRRCGSAHCVALAHVSVAVSIGTVARHRDVDTFLRNVDGKAVEGRYEDGNKVAPLRPLVQEEFGDLPGVGVEEVLAMFGRR